ncbi:hypothetical protein [Deinococcus yavapaiensis]|uniref:Uncharacterized protein n=1 Tax=Deinococcus yavapaiensis KR-236 TaxID=694435 RepID=A0A318SEZ4_9DEIO|nr:hypothetical protein [Deinococcus yavapaiensis]PYE51929.1 hypothetical protein DES52_114130 [Deinococcus yavapaiensis KR-236]
MTEVNVASAGRSLVTWLTVLQALSVVGAAASLALLFVPSGAGLPAGILLGITLVQILLALVYVLVLQLTKGWMTNARMWATGEGTPDPDVTARQGRTLSGWLVFGQWLPVVALPIVGGLVWYASSLALDPAVLAQSGVDTSSLPSGMTSEQIAGVARIGILVTLVMFGLPSIVINFAILGWIRRWMSGVTDAVAGRSPSETRLPELAGTLGRWFTFFQVLLVFFAALLLIVPLLPTQEGVNAGLGDRLNLLLAFLQLALYTALLQWSKSFMFGVTRRAAGQASR